MRLRPIAERVTQFVRCLKFTHNCPSAVSKKATVGFTFVAPGPIGFDSKKKDSFGKKIYFDCTDFEIVCVEKTMFCRA
jgi:hypothetical protein